MNTQEILEEMSLIIFDMNKIADENGLIDEIYFDRALGMVAKLFGLAEVVGIKTPVLNFSPGSTYLGHQIQSAMREVRFQVTKRATLENHAAAIHVYLVALSSEDIERVQTLINQCRDLISLTNELDDKHRRRLLLRLESLQKEIHKTKSSLDVALAGLVEVGDAFGKFGVKVKPLVDRFREIASVFNGKSEEPLQLPAPQKQLPPPESENSENK